MKMIEVKDLVKNYKDVEAVKGISFSVEEGAFFAFLRGERVKPGPSCGPGCGSMRPIRTSL